MSYLEPVLVHPVRRQNFGDAVAQKCNPYLIWCHIDICDLHGGNLNGDDVQHDQVQQVSNPPRNWTSQRQRSLSPVPKDLRCSLH